MLTETSVSNAATSKTSSKLFPLQYGLVATTLMSMPLALDNDLDSNTYDIPEFSYYESNESTPKINQYIAKQILSDNTKYTHDLKFFNLVQKLSDIQIELDTDFKTALNRVTSRIARNAPTKRRF